MAPALHHRHFIVGITGGIAAYKSCELVRRLMEAGATVQVIMTAAGTQFVSARTFSALSGRPVYTDEWSSPPRSGPANAMPHIDLAREADAILIAPASADFLAQLAGGLTSSLLATLCLARDKPLLVAPAMNRQMWQNPATQRNVAQLIADGVEILGPASGAQACGETGDGRMLEPHELLDALLDRFGEGRGPAPASNGPNIRGVLQDQRVLITAGPTFEPIDPVRGITNRSSGKMGFALARAASRAGATVTLIAGPVHLPTPDHVRRIDVVTAIEMHDTVMRELDNDGADIFIGVAAVADWRVDQVAGSKLKKEHGGSLEGLSWIENPDILAAVAHRADPPFCVGFAAESGSLSDLHGLLQEKRARKSVPLLIGNIGAETFGSDHNTVVVCDAYGTEPLASAHKDHVAEAIVARIAHALRDNA